MLKKCKAGSGYGLYTCRYNGNNYRVKKRFSKYSDKYDIYEDGSFIDSANTLKACEDIIRGRNIRSKRSKVKNSKSKPNTLKECESIIRGSRSKRSKVKNIKPNTQHSTTKIKENVTLLDLIKRFIKTLF